MFFKEGIVDLKNDFEDGGYTIRPVSVAASKYEHMIDPAVQ